MKKILVTIDPLTDDILSGLAESNGVSKSDLIRAAATLASMQEEHANLIHFARAARTGKRKYKRRNNG